MSIFDKPYVQLDIAASERQSIEAERDELLVMLTIQVRVAAKLAERVEHWHNQYLELRKKHE